MIVTHMFAIILTLIRFNEWEVNHWPLITRKFFL